MFRIDLRKRIYRYIGSLLVVAILIVVMFYCSDLPTFSQWINGPSPVADFKRSTLTWLAIIASFILVW